MKFYTQTHSARVGISTKVRRIDLDQQARDLLVIFENLELINFENYLDETENTLSKTEPCLSKSELFLELLLMSPTRATK